MRPVLLAVFLMITTIGTMSSIGGAADPFEITAILSLSGPAAFLGTREAMTLAMVERLANKAGGVRGRPIKFVIKDDQSQPAIAVQLTNNVIAKKGAVIIGPSLAATCNAVAPLLKSGPLLYCISPAFHGEPGSYAFNGSPSSADSIDALLRYLHSAGLNRIAVISSTDASGEDGIRAIKAAIGLATNQGMSIVADERFTLQDVTVTAQIARISAAAPNVLIVWTTGSALATVLRGASDAGMTLPVATTEANAIPDQLQSYSAFMAKELLLVSEVNLSPDPPVSRSIKRAITAYYDALRAAGVQPNVTYSYAWDLSWIILDAFKKYGTDATPDQLRSYIENLHGWVGADGEYDFRGGSRSGLGVKNKLVFRWDPNKALFVAVSKPGGAL